MRNPYYPNQKDINDLTRDLGLTMSNAKMFDAWAHVVELVG